MTERSNALRWDGGPGHYEVWYLTLTDPATGIGVWLRYTLLAPLDGAAECALWLVAMAPDGDRFARKATFPAAEPRGRRDDPFALTLGGADLSDRGAAGAIERRRVGAVVGAAPAALRARPPAPRARRSRQDRARPPARRPRGLGHRAARRAPARARRRARRPGAPVGHPPRRALGVGALQRPPRRRTASRARTRSSTPSRSTSRAWAARSGRARRSSGASAARTSPRPTRSRSSGPAAASA